MVRIMADIPATVDTTRPVVRKNDHNSLMLSAKHHMSTIRNEINWTQRSMACTLQISTDMIRLHDRQLCYYVHTSPAPVRGLDYTWREYRLAHPQMVDMFNRQHTFEMSVVLMRRSWSEFCPIPVDMLCALGFFVSIPEQPEWPQRRQQNENNNDEQPLDTVTCFACGVKLGNWRPSESPIHEHCRLTRNRCVYAMFLYKMLARPDNSILRLQCNRVNVLVPIASASIRGTAAITEYDQRFAKWRNLYASEEARLASFQRYGLVCQADDDYVIRPTLRMVTELHRSIDAYIRLEIFAKCGFFPIGRNGWFECTNAVLKSDSQQRSIYKVGNRDVHVQPEHHGPLINEGYDAMQCFACGYVFYNWHIDACPWTEHASWSINCPFIYGESQQQQQRLQLARRQRRQRRRLRRRQQYSDDIGIVCSPAS